MYSKALMLSEIQRIRCIKVLGQAKDHVEGLYYIDVNPLFVAGVLQTFLRPRFCYPTPHSSSDQNFALLPLPRAEKMSKYLVRKGSKIFRRRKNTPTYAFFHFYCVFKKKILRKD